VATRAGMAGEWWEMEAGLGRNCLVDSNDGATCVHWLGVLLHMTTPLGESADDELLSQTGTDSFCGFDCKVAKDKPNAAI
jgi:hypothetical protein